MCGDGIKTKAHRQLGSPAKHVNTKHGSGFALTAAPQPLFRLPADARLALLSLAFVFRRYLTK